MTFPASHKPAGAAEPALPGRRRSAPSGGSDHTQWGAWGLHLFGNDIIQTVRGLGYLVPKQ